MNGCTSVFWCCYCLHVLISLLWISRIFACFTLSVSPCLPPALFSFVSLPPSSSHPAIQNQSTPHSQTSGKVRSFHYLSSYAEGRRMGGVVRPPAGSSCPVVYQSLWSSALPESLTLPSPFQTHACCWLHYISAWSSALCCMCQNCGCFVFFRHLWCKKSPKATSWIF